jgi:hypothetical protein
MHWQLVGSLIYLTLIRPNILYTVGVMSCYIQNPKKSHLEAIQKILRYAESTIGYGISYKEGTYHKLVDYCDVDYTREHDT